MSEISSDSEIKILDNIPEKSKYKKDSKKNYNNSFYLDDKEDIKILGKKLKKRKKTSNKKNSTKNEKEKIDKKLNKIKPNYEFKSNPEKIKYLKDITNDSYSNSYSDNIFIIFESFNNILYLIYSNKNNSIVTYNLIDVIKTNEIKNAHSEQITNFRHYLDSFNERDLILSISSKKNNLKVWNFQKFECIYNYEKVNKTGYMNSASFLNYNNKIYVVTSHYRFSSSKIENIKIFNLNGNKVKEIDDSNEPTVFIDIYYDKRLSKIFIVTGNFQYVKSYDFKNNCLYNKYSDKDKKYHDSIIINENEEIIKLIESSGDGHLRIWDFHKGVLLKKIRINKTGIFGICQWNNNYLFIGCKKTIKLINIEDETILLSLKGSMNEIVTIKKMIHSQFGECLLSLGRENNQIKIWIVEK